MLRNTTNLPILLPSHDALQRSKPLTDLQHLALNNHLLALGHRTEVRDVQAPRHPVILPEARLTDADEGHGGAQVEERGGSAAVEVVKTVAVLVLAGECERGRRVRPGACDGDGF